MLSSDSTLRYLEELGNRRRQRIESLSSVEDVRDIIADVINDMEGLYIILSDALERQQQSQPGFVPFSPKRD